MRSDNLEPADLGHMPKCGHGVPMRIACSLCADPLDVTAPDFGLETMHKDGWYPDDPLDAAPSAWLGGALLLAALLVGFALGRVL